MFDIGWTEMMVIALIALIVIGPKDLPGTLKTVAHWVRKARSLTREFQSGIDDMVREAELDDAKKMLDDTRRGNLQQTIGNAIDPTGDVTEEVREIEREARREEPASGDSSSPADDSAVDTVASVVTKPATNVAPPHSLTPPAEPAAATAPTETSPEPAPAGKEDSKQSA